MTNLPTGSGRKARPRSGAPRVLPRFEDAVGIKVDRDLTEDQMMSRSPIARRIFIFNMVAIGVLVAGLFLLSQQEENLIEQRTAAMVSEAESVTRTLAAFAVERDGASESIDPVRARDLVRVIARPEGSRIRVYSADGTELVDSEATIGAEMRLIAAARGQADATEPEPGAFDDLMGRLRGMLERLRVPGSEPNLGPLLDAARGGDRRILVARAEDGTLGMYIALPVFAGADPVGAVLLSTQGGDIDRLVSRQRAQTVAAVSLSLLVATVLSIILARSIARPLRLLAAAAERTGGTGRDPSRAKIPDFDDRPDEIGYLTRTLRSMTETLFDRLEVNEAFAADVSHEIKNPLTSLRSAVETMGYAKTDEQRARLLAIIENDVKRLDRLVTDISNASRLDTELVREEAEPFDMARLCDSLVDHARAPAEKRGVALAVSGTREETFMNGLEGRLAQVISNLLSNAVSFSPEGSTVRLRLSSTPEAIRIAVEDEGPGIPDANLEDVFERFYSERPGQEFGSHSGLGLAISRQIVEAHRGTIRAENRRPAGAGLDTPPQGARFVVELPR